MAEYRNGRTRDVFVHEIAAQPQNQSHNGGYNNLYYRVEYDGHLDEFDVCVLVALCDFCKGVKLLSFLDERLYDAYSRKTLLRKVVKFVKFRLALFPFESHKLFDEHTPHYNERKRYQKDTGQHPVEREHLVERKH